jgi:cytochrome b pre-mRNA-processing protein 3
LNFLSRLLRGGAGRRPLQPLYDAAVERARDPVWYREGEVPDTIDGRFDMIATLLSLILVRLEAEEAAHADSAKLTELFIDDMDGTLRQLGIGDVVVGKHVGKMMGALGGRLGSFRAALGGEGDFEAAVRRNVFRNEPPSEASVAAVGRRLRDFSEGLGETSLEQLRAGALPAA